MRKYRWVMISFSFVIAFLSHLLLFATAPMVTQIMKEMNLLYVGYRKNYFNHFLKSV